MARHNREGRGSDQRGYEYDVSYQPDWLKVVKVTRSLESGRQSSKTLFRNPSSRAKESPGEKVRTRLLSKEQGLDFEITIDDPNHVITRVRVTCRQATPQERSRGGRAKKGLLSTAMDNGGDDIEFTFEDTLPPPDDE